MNAKLWLAPLTGLGLMASNAAVANDYQFGDWTVRIRPLQVAQRETFGLDALAPLPRVDNTPQADEIGEGVVPEPPADFRHKAASPPATDVQPIAVEAAETTISPGMEHFPVDCSSSELANRYREIYEAIPFSRSEYNANPSYRHDATLEILFGKQRPTVIHRGPVVQAGPTIHLGVTVEPLSLGTARYGFDRPRPRRYGYW